MRRAEVIATLWSGVQHGGYRRCARGVRSRRRQAQPRHGEHADHARSITLVRRAASSAGRAVGILADLQPEDRVGRRGGSSMLRAGAPGLMITAKT